MQDFRTLRVWHRARTLSLEVIQALPERGTRKIPGLRQQAIRAATSVVSNLAEGCSRRTRPEFLRFVEIALGSLNGLDAQLSLARDAGVLTTESCAPCERHIVVTRRMLISLSRTLQRRIAEEAATALAAVEEPAP